VRRARDRRARAEVEARTFDADESHQSDRDRDAEPLRPHARHQLLRGSRREQRQRQRGQRRDPPWHAYAVPPGREVVEQAVRIEVAVRLLEAERKHRAHRRRNSQADANPPPVDRPEQPRDREPEDRDAREERLLGRPVERVADALRGPSPDQVLLRRGHERRHRARQFRDLRTVALRLGMLVQHLQVRTAQQEAGEGEQRDPHGRHTQHRRAETPALPDRHDHRYRRERQQQVSELQPERESEAELPRRHKPAGQHEAAALVAISPQEQEQGQRDAAAREHVQVTILLESPGRVGVRGARDRRPGPSGAELAREQPRAQEAKRVGEQEEHVVAEHRRRDSAADRAGRRVARERLGEREAVLERPEHVGLEVVERLVQQGVSSPGHLPRLDERVAGVARQVARHVQRQRPMHHQREQHGGQRGQRDLAPRERWTRCEHVTRRP